MKNIRLTLLFLILSLTVNNTANAYCEYKRNGAGNGEIRLKFVDMKNAYHALYPECATLPDSTCFQFDYDADGCLRNVYFIPVSASQAPIVFNITELYGQFDHLSFWTFDGDLIMYGIYAAFLPVILGYFGATIKHIVTSR